MRGRFTELSNIPMTEDSRNRVNRHRFHSAQGRLITELGGNKQSPELVMFLQQWNGET